MMSTRGKRLLAGVMCSMALLSSVQGLAGSVQPEEETGLETEEARERMRSWSVSVPHR